MKIVSWNLNGLIASMKNDAIEPLRDRKPDIICFQRKFVHSKSRLH